MRKKKMTKIDIKFQASIKEIIGLYESDVFSVEKTEELLKQFKKDELIKELLYTESYEEDPEDIEDDEYETEEDSKVIETTAKKSKKKEEIDEDLDLDDEDLDDL